MMASAETTTTLSADKTKHAPRKFRFTKTSVAALPIPEAKPSVYWDTDPETPGFGVRISPAGRRTFFLQSRTRAGRAIKMGCGVFGRRTVDQARATAKRYLAKIELDGDPAAELKAERQAERDRRRERADVKQLWADYELNHVGTLRPKSQRAYRSWYANHILPELGHIKIGDLSRGRVENLMRKVAATAGKSTSNRVQAVLGGHAKLWRTRARRGRPPQVRRAQGPVPRHQEPRRARA